MAESRSTGAAGKVLVACLAPTPFYEPHAEISIKGCENNANVQSMTAQERDAWNTYMSLSECKGKAHASPAHAGAALRPSKALASCLPGPHA